MTDLPAILLADDAEAHRPIVDAIENLVERSALHQIGVVDAETAAKRKAASLQYVPAGPKKAMEFS